MSKLEDYMEHLKFRAIIYDDYISDDFDYQECINYMLTDNFVEKLYEHVKANELLQAYDDQVKDNIRTIVFFIHENIKINRKYNISLLNEITCSLNNTPDINSLKFYKKELLKRQGNDPDKNKRYCDDEYFALNDIKKEAIRYSIIMDYDTIDALLNDNEEDFINEVVKNELLNEFFISTLNIVKLEQSNLYKNETFRRRSLYVLQSIREVVKNKSKLYTRKDGKDIDRVTARSAKKMIRTIRKQ